MKLHQLGVGPTTSSMHRTFTKQQGQKATDMMLQKTKVKLQVVKYNLS